MKRDGEIVLCNTQQRLFAVFERRPSTSIDLSVVVPCYNSSQYIERCIEGLLDQDLPRTAYELLFVDNNSTDGSADLIRRYEPHVRLLHQGRQGAYAARNRALEAARGRVVAFTDPDCVPRRDWLSQALYAFSPGVEVVVGRNDFPIGSTGLRLLMLYEHHKDHHTFGSDDPTLYYAHTNNMAVTRRAMDRYGPFVERARGADTIFVRQVVEALGTGAVLYAPTMRVTHLEVASLSTYFRKVFTYGRSRRQYQSIMRTRPLSFHKRLAAFRSARVHEGLSLWASARLFGLLVTGLLYWHTGTLAGIGRKPDNSTGSLTSGLSETAEDSG